MAIFSRKRAVSAPPVAPYPQSIGNQLVDQGVITSDQLEAALREQRRHPRELVDIILALKLCDPEPLLDALSYITGHPAIHLSQMVLDADIVKKLPKTFASSIPAILVDETEEGYYVAVPDPEDLITLDELRTYLPPNHPIHLCHAVREHILAAIDIYYPPEATEELHQEGEAIRLVQSILIQGVRLGASDIHLQPDEHVLRMKFRLDGVLGQDYTLHRDHWAALNVRLKVMSRANISESRRPQSGRFSLTFMGREIDFRVSFHPTLYGENIVIRILDKARSLQCLEELGFMPEDIHLLKRYANHPQGMMIFSGPTGSGKTTSLYALLAYMDSKHKNIMTLEDPVEYEVPSIRQTEVREGGPFSFAEGIRSLLRQDPDVIFVSEIRDPETAQMALRASMTGHLVLATLHATNSFSVPGRLMDLGIHPSLLSGSLLCSVSQRLIRKLCPNCKQVRLLHATDRKYFPDIPHIYQASGCAQCYHTGYRGRMVIAEILPIDDHLEQLIAEGASRARLSQAAPIATLWDKALQKAREGDTSLEEIDRVIGAPL
jgi:type IV pilus assembly protein PilB